MAKRVYVYFWGIDCDCLEGDEMRTFSSKEKAVKAIDSFYDGAEGRCSANYVSRNHYKKYRNSLGIISDHISEAYENGYGTCVDIV